MEIETDSKKNQKLWPTNSHVLEMRLIGYVQMVWLTSHKTHIYQKHKGKVPKYNKVDLTGVPIKER